MDTKLESFLTLCRMMNYRIAAEELHLSQPAVTKQMQALEQYYGIKLFVYDGRKLHKTREAEILEQYCRSLQYNDREIRKELQHPTGQHLRIGATKTVGDYVMGEQIAKYLSNPHSSLDLTVDNTERLLKMLDDASLDFAVIEGFFQKEKYAFRRLRKEPFLGICAANHPFAGRIVSPEELRNETLIVREEGSGTRDILEHELKRLNYDLSLFCRVVCISSFKVIRELILKDIGISFLYQAVGCGEKRLATFQVENFHHEYEFHVVYLKNTDAGKYAECIFGEGNGNEKRKI